MLVATGFILAWPNDKTFWEDGVMKMPERLQKAVEQTVNTLFNTVIGENEKRLFLCVLT